MRTVTELAAVLRRLRRREARARGGSELTYRELAAKAGWSHTVVAAYLTGRSLPSTHRFDTLVQLLGASAAEQGALATVRDRVEELRRTRSGSATVRSVLPEPRQLPADVPGFTGRVGEIAEVAGAFLAADRPPAVTVVAVVGPAGVGKTALAVHVGHRIRHQFPHGQLYADLRGHNTGAAAAPERVLDGFLATLGIAPADIPPHADAKAALFRSVVDGRRLLLLLDDVADARQVRPLLPASSGCGVLVTGRTELTGLVASCRARRTRLEPLPAPEAVSLLTTFTGPERVNAEPAAAAWLVELCHRLPAALCAAGEYAAARPGTALRTVAGTLAGSDCRLNVLGSRDH